MDERRSRVLVIDDDHYMGRLLGRMLEREYNVLVMTSAREALEQIGAGERFDFILCDLMMPGLTGVDFDECLESIAPELRARVVYMTGGAFTPYTQAFLQRPSIRHIEKPFPTAQELRQIIVEHIRRFAGHR